MILPRYTRRPRINIAPSWPIFLLLPALSLLGGCKQRRERADTLAWMDNTYNSHTEVVGSYGHGSTGSYRKGENGQPDSLESGYDQSFTHRGCQVNVTIKENPSAELGKDMLSDDTISFNLGDLNPASIKVSPRTHYGGIACADYLPDEICDWAEITVKTHNEAPLVQVNTHLIFPKLTGKDHDVFSPTKDSGTYFEVEDVEYAQQFAKALRHAIELCGGKPESF